DEAQARCEHTATRTRAYDLPLCHPPQQNGHPLGGALAQPGGIRVRRLEVAEVVGPDADGGRQLEPRVRTDLVPAPSDARDIRQQRVWDASVSKALAMTGHDMDLVPGIHQPSQYRLVHPERAEVPHRKEYAHVSSKGASYINSRDRGSGARRPGHLAATSPRPTCRVAGRAR